MYYVSNLVPQENWQRMQMKMMVMITVFAPLSLFRNTTVTPSKKLLKLRTSLTEICFSCFFSHMMKIV